MLLNSIPKRQMIHLLIFKILHQKNLPKKIKIMPLEILILILFQNQPLQYHHQILKFNKSLHFPKLIVYQILVLVKFQNPKIFQSTISRQTLSKQKAQMDSMISCQVLNKMSQTFQTIRINSRQMLMLIEIIILICKEINRPQISFSEMVLQLKFNSLRTRQ